MKNDSARIVALRSRLRLFEECVSRADALQARHRAIERGTTGLGPSDVAVEAAYRAARCDIDLFDVERACEGPPEVNGALHSRAVAMRASWCAKQSPKAWPPDTYLYSISFVDANGNKYAPTPLGYMALG